MLVLALLGSLGLNALLFLFGVARLGGGETDSSGPVVLEKTLYSVKPAGPDKVAVVKIDGTIMEGMVGAAQKGIEKAARDKNVKAVVVRVESPGGTITASDDLHRRLEQLRDGTSKRYQSPAKPLVASFGNLAASGGYYVAMPAAKIFAEKTTITGSIGVYASFPNVAEFAHKYGIKMEMVKAGDIKGSGSLFHEVTPQERQPWQDMVNTAYGQFLAVVEKGRPQLQGKLTTDLFPPKRVPLRDDKGNVVLDESGKPKLAEGTYTRKLADGGIFTAEDAKSYGLVDEIGTLEDAAEEAARAAGLSGYKVVTYERPMSLFGLLSADGASGRADFARLADAAGPRLWYMLPQAELSGLLAAAGR